MENGSSDAARRGAEVLLDACGCLRRGESVLIVCDPGTRAVAEVVASLAHERTGSVEVREIPELAMHGMEPPEETARRMRGADLCLGLTRKSMAHTRARLAAAREGRRYLSLPDYSLDLLAGPALRADFRSRARLAAAVADAFSAGERVEVTSRAGTAMRLDIRGRTGNCCPGVVSGPGALGSPPDIEANVSPVETASEGTVVVDGSIPFPGLGLMGEPVTLRVSGGAIADMRGPADVVARLRRLFESAGSPKALVLAECGVGLNDRAELDGTMLTDEGAYGTMHFGFGSNATVGGLNDVPFHLDFVFRDPTLRVDGREILADGRLR